MDRRFSGTVAFFLRIALSILFAGIALGCTGGRQPKLCRDFFGTSLRQDERFFERLNLEEQLVIQKCGLQQHPNVDFSYKISDRGKAIVPDLLRVLEGSDWGGDEDFTRVSVIKILERLSERGEFPENVHDFNVLARSVERVHTPWLRERADESVAKIRKNSGGHLE